MEKTPKKLPRFMKMMEVIESHCKDGQKWDDDDKVKFGLELSKAVSAADKENPGFKIAIIEACCKAVRGRMFQR